MCDYSGIIYVKIMPLQQVRGKAAHLNVEELEKVEKYIDELLLERGVTLVEA